jgi:hypothetical protein
MNERKDIGKIFEEGVAIDRALRKAVREALRRHKLLGNPVAVCRDDKVVWIAPEDIPDAFDDDDLPTTVEQPRSPGAPRE